MPTTRRSTRASSGPGKQSTLSFKNKVTKSIKAGKEGYKSPARAKEYIPEPSPAPDAGPDAELQSPATPTTPVSVATPVSAKTEDDHDHDRKLQQLEDRAAPAVAEVVVAAPADKSEAECKAEKVSDAAIERYWRGIEASRGAREVHKKHGEGLTTGEKVLRYFDVSSHYGPCIGVARLKRWQRAQRLGLNPPIEVLAVLLKEERKGNKGIERAHMDELLNSAAVDSI